MKIKSVTIKNYKSIKEITIPFEEYGIGNNKSKTAFLVGINESGKSAILEALNLINNEGEDVSYESCCFKPAADKDDDIMICVKFEVTNPNALTKLLKEKCEFPDELCKKIRLQSITKNIIIYSDDSKTSSYSIGIDEFPTYEYVIEKAEEVKDLESTATTIKSLKKANNIKTQITPINYVDYLKENQNVVDTKYLKEIIEKKLYPNFQVSIPKVQIWRPDESYLITSAINLNEFKEDPNISIPLKNMFFIYGKTQDAEIKSCIEKALSKTEHRDRLTDGMTSAVTKHINGIWSEHKITIKISINGMNCEVNIVDRGQKHNYLTMSQRSDGFKQFISLMLSLSVLNKKKKLSNQLILIDEPEIHLHPSAIEDMRNELLRLGSSVRLRKIYYA